MISCDVCDGECWIERPLKTVTYYDYHHNEECPVTIGGVDACPQCATVAEVEYRT